MFDFRNFLESPGAYSMQQKITVGKKNVKKIINEFIQPFNGAKILDIGCGPADILKLLPECDYVGFDLSEKYIQKAQKSYKNRTSTAFYCKAVSANILQELDLQNSFDRVIASNIQHHLNDKEVLDLLNIAFCALKNDGKLITIDSCLMENDTPISSFFTHNDRGQFVRYAEEYENLIKKVFPNIKKTCSRNYNNLGVSGVIFECFKQ